MKIKKILFLTSLPLFVLVLSGCSSDNKKPEEVPLSDPVILQEENPVAPSQNSDNTQAPPSAPSSATNLEPLPADSSAAIDSELKNIDATLKSTDASINSNNTPDSSLGL